MLKGESCAGRLADPETVVTNCDRALSLTACGYLVFAYVAAEFHLPYVPLCPYLLFTGTPCPLCGSTRWIGALMHGEVIPAQNLFATVVWFGMVVFIATISLRKLRESGSDRDPASR